MIQVKATQKNIHSPEIKQATGVSARAIRHFVSSHFRFMQQTESMTKISVVVLLVWFEKRVKVYTLWPVVAPAGQIFTEEIKHRKEFRQKNLSLTNCSQQKSRLHT